jgi:hypothetical protein
MIIIRWGVGSNTVAAHTLVCFACFEKPGIYKIEGALEPGFEMVW